MKKFLFTILAVALASASASAQSRTAEDGEEVYHYILMTAQYQMGDFGVAKESGSYGLGLAITSLSHWKKFHVGGNMNLSINNGFVPKDYSAFVVDFGPSFRVDFSKHCFLNTPVNAVCNVTFPKGKSSCDTSWGLRIAPSVHGFFSDRFGVFAGPQLNVGFSGGSEVSFGMQAGISYSF